MIARHWRSGIVIAVVSAATISLCFAASNPPALKPDDDSISTRGAPSWTVDAATTAQLSISGNPLWAIPHESLSATRERPIFSPSRRPPPVLAAAPLEPPKPPPPAPEAQRPALRLLGIVSGAIDGFAIFINETTQNIVRLKTGEGHEGWILRSVKAREAVLENNRRRAVLALPSPMEDRK